MQSYDCGGCNRQTQWQYIFAMQMCISASMVVYTYIPPSIFSSDKQQFSAQRWLALLYSGTDVESLSVITVVQYVWPTATPAEINHKTAKKLQQGCQGYRFADNSDR